MVSPFVAFPLVKYVGRRPILIFGAAVMAFCMLAFSIIGVAAPGSDAAAKCLIAFICIFVFTFSATWGAIGNVVIGEVPSNRLRSKTLSIAFTACWCVATAVTTSIPSLLNLLETKVGFIFGGITLVLLVITILIVPETKDRTLEEIDEMFLNVSFTGLLSTPNFY
jgi:MFS transporter, SP family, sugar:H+ symporter